MTPTYRSWLSMRSRCRNPNNESFQYYGGRGIAIAPRWDSFEAFLADMGERPEGASLDRIDVNGNYEPGNCRWATMATQARNTRQSKLNTVARALMAHMRRRGARAMDIAHAFGVSAVAARRSLASPTWTEVAHAVA